MRDRGILLVCILLTMTVGVTAAQQTDPTSQSPHNSERRGLTGICELTKNGVRFNGKRVLVSAAVLGTVEHGFALIDRGCKGGVAINIPNSATGLQDYQALMKPVQAEGGATDGSRITATFSGLFHYYPKVRRPKWVLDVDRISDVEVRQGGHPNP